MDILSQAIADTGTLHVKSASGDLLFDNGKPVRITVFGPGSEAYARIETRQTQRAMKRRDANDGKLVAMSPEERLTETAEDLADITTSFEHLEYNGLDGRALFEGVYGDRRLGFIVNQVTKFLADWGNFKGASPAN